MITKRTRRKLNKALAALLGLLSELRLRRMACGLLSLVLALSAFSVQAYALSWKTLADVSPAEEASQSGSSEPMLNAAGNYNYILEVSSGTRLGGGYADNIQYFSVSYTDTTGTRHTSIMMPGVDAVENTLKTAAAVSSPAQRQSSVEELFGYTTEDLTDHKALGSVTSDQLLFESANRIVSIDKIQVFGRRTSSDSVWPCQGMRVYEVHEIYGLEMYGWYSDTGFINFSGTVIAEAVMAPGGGNFTWNTTGGTFNILPMQEGSPQEITLVRTTDKEKYESTYRKTTHVGTTVGPASQSPVVIRMDLADKSGAGFESMALSYETGAKPPVTSAGFCEVAALTVRYQDLFGDQRDVRLPLIINSLGPALDVLGTKISIAGYAQQGDSLAIPALLPALSRVTSVKVTLGAAQAEELTGIKDINTGSQLRAERKADSASDDISYTCLAFYTDVEAGVALDGAVIRYSYEAGENNPIYYSSASSTDGLALGAGQSWDIPLNEYNSRLVLEPVDYHDQYLITISTDNVENAGTTGDLQIQFKYISLKDKEEKSPLYHVKDYIQAFYGNWEGIPEGFAYRWGMRDGGTAQFVVPLSEVKEFTGVGFKLEGQDEWQFSGVRIDSVKTIGKRSIVWEELSGSELDADGTPRFRSHVSISRSIELNNSKDRPIFVVGNVYEEDDPSRPQGGSADWTPGTLVQDDDNTTEFNGQGEVVDKQGDTDWGSILHYMTYEQAIQNLKFTKQRTNYKVSVNVGGDKVNADDDDCGSRNLFYFQLIFESGKSGCVLANQQIAGDAFRTGTITEFYIPCAQDYGDLTAIQIIPDDQDGNSDIYDKLMIKSIEVEKVTDDFICPTWAATSADPQGLGWVGIDYRDQGEISTNKGAEGRSIAEIATTYQITESSYNAKFLIAIKTGSYQSVPRANSDGKVVYIQDPTFYGGMSMTYSYFDRNGVIQNVRTPIDVVSLMYDYTARSASHQRKTSLSDENYEVNYAVSDPAYNFRAGKSDSFYITVKNISQFVNMSLQLRSDVVTHWNIASVMIYLVNGQGIRYINGNGEYDYRYPGGKEPTLVAEWTREEGLTADLGIYRYKQDTGIQEISNIQLDCQPINLNPNAAGWATVIPREPNSNNDTFNLFIYPQQGGDGVADPESYQLKAAVQYKNALTLKPVQVSAGTLRKAYDEDGDLYCLYAIGLDGKNMASFEGVIVDTDSLVPINVPLSGGVLQVVRGGVLMESYDLGTVMNADLGDIMTISTNSADSHKQKIYLQFSGDTQSQKIEPETKDIAVALHFRSDDPSAQELRSKYVYLSDAGYTSIDGGRLYELDMDLGDLSSITAINIACIGAVEATVVKASAVEVDAEGNVYNSFSSDSSYTITGRAGRIEAHGSVTPLTLELVTAPDENTVSSGTAGPIRLTIGYYDHYGRLLTESYDDIRPYITEGEGFVAGGTDIVKLLVPELSELRWVELEPLKAEGAAPSSMATWKLASLSASAGYDGRTASRSVDQLIIEGEPLHLTLADILLYGKVTITVSTGESGDASSYSVNSGGSLSCLMDSGNSMSISTRVFGSGEGTAATVENYDPTSGAVAKARLNARHGYTEDYLKSIYEESSADAASGSLPSDMRQAASRAASIAYNMMSGNGTFLQTGDYILFTAPRNYTGRDLYYRISVKSSELEDVCYNVDVTVYSETDTLPDAINIWKTAKSNAAAAQAAEAAAQQSAASESSTTGGGISQPSSSEETSSGAGIE